MSFEKVFKNIFKLYFKDSNSMPICKALLKCENEISLTNNWRLSAMMWAQLEILPKYFSSDVIYKFFVPVVITRILKAVNNFVNTFKFC